MSRLLLSFLLLISFSASASPELRNKQLSGSVIEEIGFVRAVENFYEELTLENEELGIQELAKLQVTHGWLGADVGGGRAFIKTDIKGQILKISIKVDVEILGVQLETINESISIKSLLKGEPLKFFMDGAKEPSLLIAPGKSFSKTGGSAKIKVLNKNGEYESESVSISKNSRGHYAIKQKGKSLQTLKINMRGVKISSMYVGDYDFY
jgi:hypothetical protein